MQWSRSGLEHMEKLVTRSPPTHRAEDELDGLVGYHLRRASFDAMARLTAALAEAGSRPVLFSVLSLIVEKPGITAAEICRQLAIQRANIVSILTELESLALFVREGNPEDQRVQ